MSSTEKLAMFLNILAHHEKNRFIKVDYIRSGWSCYLLNLIRCSKMIMMIDGNDLRNLNFIYVLPGWEGSVANGRVLQDVVVQRNGLKYPRYAK
ncbi:hypothetical protein KY290_001503 [Solanum tuberosum]|uniref:Uncharacterized protein n=1 Tax=Solanum tuberosum TaxID=4113 RepID=A0ABQ7WPM9_SOLTU|nr:hypothetical protein KY290_001503 [Solanum tuberosum]